MRDVSRHDAWQAGQNYERYMGRWSRQIAPRFLDWMGAGEGLEWLETGCGTGALSAAIVTTRNPASLLAIDPSAGFLAEARNRIEDPRVSFRTGDAQDLDLPAASRDIAVSALALNFVPDRQKALGEMRRVVRPAGTVGFYVWDYPGGGIEFMRRFWAAATALDASAAELSEDRRFPFCTAAGLTALAVGSGLATVECVGLEVPTVFRDFDDYWLPFTLGTGPAPGYCASLEPGAREALRRRLAETLPRGPDGTIPLRARAWAVRGTVPAR